MGSRPERQEITTTHVLEREVVFCDRCGAKQDAVSAGGEYFTTVRARTEGWSGYAIYASSGANAAKRLDFCHPCTGIVSEAIEATLTPRADHAPS